MSMFKSKRLDKEQRKKAGIIVALLLMSVSVIFYTGYALSAQDGSKPVTYYGDYYIYVRNTNDPVEASMVLDAADGLKVTFNPTVAEHILPDELICSLYKSSAIGYGDKIESGEGGWHTTAYIWVFDLGATSTGTYSYFIAFSGYDGDYGVHGESFEFQITNEEAPTHDNPEITESPEDVHFGLMESPAHIDWRYVSYGPSEITVEVNNEIVESQTAISTGIEQTFRYYVDTAIDGIQNIVFEIMPEDPANPPVSDTVIVTVETAGTDTTTTDTDTTTTDTTTDTTTTDDTPPPSPPDEEAVLVMIAIGVSFGIILVGILFVKGGATPKTKQMNKGENKT